MMNPERHAAPAEVCLLDVFPRLAGELEPDEVERARGALSHLRRVDTRLLVALWHLADRWGSVHPEGVVVPIRLTHEMLGHVIGAQRPSVTTALGQLESAGRISRRPGGGWILHGEPPAELGELEDEAAGGPAPGRGRRPEKQRQ